MKPFLDVIDKYLREYILHDIGAQIRLSVNHVIKEPGPRHIPDLVHDLLQDGGVDLEVQLLLLRHYLRSTNIFASYDTLHHTLMSSTKFNIAFIYKTPTLLLKSVVHTKHIC